MNKYIIAAVLFLICSGLLGQRQFRGIPLEVNIIPNDSSYTLYISYTVSHDRLVFIKNNGYYEGGIELSVEAAVGDDIIKRESSESIVRIRDYDLTNSNKDFVQGLLTMELDSGKFDFHPQFSILNTNRTMNLPSVSHDVSSIDTAGIKPVVLQPEYSDCLQTSNYVLANYGGAIPFSPTSSIMLIPVTDQVEEVEVTLKNKEDEVILNRKLNEYELFAPILSKCQNEILVLKENTENVRVFKLDDFSTRFKEGAVKLTVAAGQNEYRHDMGVAWIDRPLSLSRATLSVGILNNIFSEQDLAELRESEEDYYESLVSFWSKYDRDTTTAFNEVMNEFYLRVDHAIVEYRSVSQVNGAATDRGKIYIKYGEPDNVERSYSDQGAILEIWKYRKFNREFVFSDASGLGNYTLIN